MELSGVAAAGAKPMTMSGASRMGGGGSEQRMRGAVSGAAQLLKMNAGDLSTMLNAGQSLAAIATSKGVARSDLLDAIKQGVQHATPQGATGVSGSLLDRIAGRIADHSGGRVDQASGNATPIRAALPDGDPGTSFSTYL